MSTALISIDEQIKCVERELNLRKYLYPKWIEKGKKKRDDCVKEYKSMEAVLQTLKIAAGGELGTFMSELSKMDPDAATAKLALVSTMQELGRSAAKIQELEVLRDQLRVSIAELDAENVNIIKRYANLSAAEVVERTKLEHAAKTAAKGGML